MGKNKILILTLLASMLCACEEEEYIAPEDQPVYFEYSYINYAWGFQHHGWMIDRDGYIRAFDQPDNYRFADSTGYMSLEDLEYNLGLTDSIIDQVNPREMKKYIDYIPRAAEGEIGESENIAADAGGSTLTCYLYDQEADAYRRVFLAQSGDWEQFNLSQEAEKLVEWLLDFDVFWLSD